MSNQPIAVALASLGCAKNLVDSEKMLGLLAEDQIILVADWAQADVVVINTCGFLGAAREESLEHIRGAIELKEAGDINRVVVAGCLVQRDRAKLLEWCPQIDALIGVFDRDRIIEAVRGRGGIGGDVAVDLPVYSSIAANATIARAHRGLSEEQAAGFYESDRARYRLTPRHYAFLRISEGCNQNCAFCTIPSIRGKMRSKSIDDIVGEAVELINDGAFELNLIGQDTTSYGDDIGFAAGLVGLLERLDQTAATSGGAWLRLMYAYPSCFTDAMIDAIARLSNVLGYIDMPLQHINDEVLERMRRRTSRKLIMTLLDKLRTRVPGIAIRTTFISGFPGETDEQHRQLVEFVEQFGFENMGVFPYSPEENTPAGTMYDAGDAVPDEVIEQRIDELMMTQQKLVFARNAKRVQSQAVFDVLIDSARQPVEPDDLSNGDGNGYEYEGRTYMQAPQVDGLTIVQSQNPLTPGQVVSCRVTDCHDYDLIAQPIEDLADGVALPILG